jgi:transcriptional regulator with XRE-family HTH domain
VKTRKSNKPLSKEEALQKVGDRLKELRIEKGFSSYEDFAYSIEISRSQIGRYERGRDLRLSTLITITNALEISLEDFFKGVK